MNQIQTVPYEDDNGNHREVMNGVFLRALQSNEEEDKEPGHIAPATIFFFALTAFLLWCCGPSLLGYLKRCCILGNPERREEETSNDIVNPNNQDSPGNHEETIDDLINSTESVGSLAELERRNALRERHRRLLVDTFLPRKIYDPEQKQSITSSSSRSSLGRKDGSGKEAKDGTNEVDNDTVGEIKKENEEQRNAVATQTNEKSPNQESNAMRDHQLEDCCVICLNPYEKGEEVSWSMNNRCNHLFHRECIVEWLVEHDDCPICRNNFLFGGGSTNNDIVEADDSSANSISEQLLRGLELWYRLRMDLESNRSSSLHPAASSSSFDIRLVPQEEEEIPSQAQGALSNSASSPPPTSRASSVEMTTGLFSSSSSSSSSSPLESGNYVDAEAPSAPSSTGGEDEENATNETSLPSPES